MNSTDQRTNLAAFGAWLRGEPVDGTAAGGGGPAPPDYTVIVDGPNVAYARQNFVGGCFSFHQIDLVVAGLRAEGERVLLVLPHKYTQAVVPNHARYNGAGPCAQHEVTAEERALLDRWTAEGILVVTPVGANDDWYWMLGSVCRDDAPARVVSNDQMRDHRLALLEPRPFLRWKTSQLVRFNLSHAYEPDRLAAGEITPPEFQLRRPPAYSPEIQRSVAADGRRVWHIPVKAAVEAPEPPEPLHLGPNVDAAAAEAAAYAAAAAAEWAAAAPHRDWLCLSLS
jgi:hypothetical protein